MQFLEKLHSIKIINMGNKLFSALQINIKLILSNNKEKTSGSNNLETLLNIHRNINGMVSHNIILSVNEI